MTTDAPKVLALLARIEAKLDALSDFKMPQYIGVKQAAKMLGETEGNIRVMMSREQIPFLKSITGNRTLLEVRDLQKLMIVHKTRDELLADYE